MTFESFLFTSVLHEEYDCRLFFSCDLHDFRYQREVDSDMWISISFVSIVFHETLYLLL